MYSFWSQIASDTPEAASAVLSDMSPMLAVVLGVALAAVIVSVVVRVVRG